MSDGCGSDDFVAVEEGGEGISRAVVDEQGERFGRKVVP